MARLERDAHLEALHLDLAHAVERGGRARDGAHVVVRHLLAARGFLAHDGAAGKLQVGAAVKRVAGHEENLLLEADVVNQAVRLEAHQVQQTRALARHGLHGAVQRGLLVQRVAVVRHEARGDEHGVLADEDGGHRIQTEVAARGVRRAHAAVGVGRPVRLALQQHLAGEVVEGLAVLVELEQGLVHLRGEAVAHAGGRHRLEPVAVHARAVVHGPVQHSLRDDVRLARLRGPGVVVQQLVGLAVLGQVLLRHRAAEAVVAEAVQRRRRRRGAHLQHRARSDGDGAARGGRGARRPLQGHGALGEGRGLGDAKAFRRGASRRSGTRRENRGKRRFVEKQSSFFFSSQSRALRPMKSCSRVRTASSHERKASGSDDRGFCERFERGRVARRGSNAPW